MKTKLLYFVLPFTFLACHSKVSSNSDSGVRSKPAYPSENIPENRKEVKADPIAEFKVKTDDPLNDFYFTVKLFETNKTFEYLLKFQFEEVRGEDTIRYPNFGMYPKPGLQKGEEKYSCVIGFYDQDNNFRNYKKVFVKDGKVLKLVTLNRYSIVTEEVK
ncbi:MAG: hypothetical protein C5B59_17090 [Bacteroidetes bacterium]|nr:MAG: hypothetical protein C5B59_17090 [Bacteroidota bacterium]